MPGFSTTVYLGYKLARIAPGTGYFLSVNMTSTMLRTSVVRERMMCGLHLCDGKALILSGR